MQYIAVASALVATAVAASYHATEIDTNRPVAKVVNRCPYDVYLWSIDKQLGCPAEAGLKLQTGDMYQENFKEDFEGGVAIKLSKFETCGGKDITQLEYFIENKKKDFLGNYLDMSFVDCTRNLEDCPGRTDGFYLISGNKGGLFKSAENNEHCPIFNVYNAEEAAKVSYIKWDDRQTKFCNKMANLELYLCGGDAPDADDETPEPVSSAVPSSSFSQVESAPSSTSTSSKDKPTPSAAEEEYVVAAAAAVTEAPAPPPASMVKTEVVYVTEYVNKRHAHGRRHQHFHA